MIIVVDTREQLPYEFKTFTTRLGTLETGDYSLAGHESQVCVERKSLADFSGCIPHDTKYHKKNPGKPCGKRCRFKACLERMQQMPCALVVVEATLSGLSTPPPHTKIRAAQAVGSYISWQMRYAPVQWMLAENREMGERVVIRWLAAYLRHLKEAA